MYANPLHPGHIDCLRLTKQIADQVWVIVNNDHQAELKRGVKSFQDEVYRKTVVDSLKYVDKTYIAVDEDSTVCQTIKLLHDIIRQENSTAKIIFTKGGDRFASEIPEAVVCRDLGIGIVDGLGEKTHNSSKILNL